MAALVHAFNLLESPPGPLVLLCAWNGDEAVNLGDTLAPCPSKLSAEGEAGLGGSVGNGVAHDG